jgi:hypothetical protein
MNKFFDIQKIKLLAAMTIGYGCFYFLNNYLTKDLYLAPAAHIVHLPSGVKMLMVLVSGTVGAIAIAIVGFAWGVVNSFSHNYILAFCLAIASAATPILSVALLNKIFELTDDLSNLTFDKLFFLSLTYASLNSLLHQIVVYSYGEIKDWKNGFLVMFTGDIAGIFIVLYLFRFGLKAIKA